MDALSARVGAADRGRVCARPGAFGCPPRTEGPVAQGRVAEFCRLPAAAANLGELTLRVAAWCERATLKEAIEALAQLGALEVSREQAVMMREMLMTRLAMLDAEVAAQVAAELPVGDDQDGDNGLQIAFERWVEIDPAAALARALTSRPAGSSERAALVGSMLRRLNQKNPELADAMAADLLRHDDENLSNELIGFQTDRLAELWPEGAGVEATLEWIDRQSAAGADRVTLGQELLRLAVRREVGAAALAGLAARFGEIRDGGLLEDVVAQIGTVRRDLAYALLGKTRDMDSLVGGWSRLVGADTGEVRAEVFEHLLAQADSSGRDRVLGDVAANLRAKAPEQALRAATAIGNQHRRNAELFQLALAWIPEGGEAARRVLPSEVVAAVDRVQEIQRSRMLDLVPGFEPTISYSAIVNPPK